MPILAWLGSKLAGYLAAVAAVAALLGGIFLRGRSQGVRSEKAAQEAAQAHTVATIKGVQAGVDTLSDSDVDRKLREWSPKP